MSDGNPVKSDEIVFRRITPKGMGKDSSGNLYISERAFLDTEKKPSVDRAFLCANGPVQTQNGGSNGVAKAVVSDIRSISGIVSNHESGRLKHTFRFDVTADPIIDEPGEPDNLAHARIQGDEELTRRPYEDLREVLSQIFTFELYPSESS